MTGQMVSSGLMIPEQQILPKSRILRRKLQRTVMDAGGLEALNPEFWAREAILRLLPRLVMGSLVNRDWEDMPKKFGDKVKAFIPGDFTFARKGALCEDVVTQSTSGTTVEVPLDQWPQVAFLICDGEEDRAFVDLVDTLLNPAIIALAEGADRILGGQVHQFYDNNVGHLQGATGTNILDYLTDARALFNQSNIPFTNRTMVLTANTETAALKNQNIINNAFVGGENTALREASLGRLLGWNLVTGNTQPSVPTGQTLETAAVNNSGGYAAGATVIAYNTDSPTDMLAVGEWFVVAGDDIPHHVTAVDTSGNSVTFTPALKYAVADDAVIKSIKSAAINNAVGYTGTSGSTPGYAKQILIDGIANSAPKIGQMVTFGNVAAAAGFETKYSIIRVDVINAGAGTYGIWLDKPLANGLADDATVNFGPQGEYNFGLYPGAFALVTRPLPKPRVGTISSVVSFNNFSIRVTISYDAVKQGHLVVVDFLMGVGVVHPDFGLVMFG